MTLRPVVFSFFGLWCMLIGESCVLADVVDLADVVGGGNGTGSGTYGFGINPLNASVGMTPSGGTIFGDSTYHTVELPFVDGVFVPNGTNQITSIATHQYTFATDNRSYDWIENGPNEGSGNFSVLAGIDYDAGPNSMIGFHANKGITFDLDAIRATTGMSIDLFSAVVGTVTGAGGDADFRVFLDGGLEIAFLDMTVNQAFNISLPISPSDRFLTLVSTDGSSDDYSADRVIVGNAKLIGVPKPICAGDGTLIEGFGVTGDFNATCGSDDSYWAAHGSSLFFQIADPVVQFELTATAPAGFGGSTISVDVEASKQSDLANLNLRALLFNFTTGSYVSLPGIMPLATTDAIQNFELPGGSDPADFIEPGTNEVRLLLQTIQTSGLPNVRTQLDEVLFNFE